MGPVRDLPAEVSQARPSPGLRNGKRYIGRAYGGQRIRATSFLRSNPPLSFNFDALEQSRTRGFPRSPIREDPPQSQVPNSTPEIDDAARALEQNPEVLGHALPRHLELVRCHR